MTIAYQDGNCCTQSFFGLLPAHSTTTTQSAASISPSLFCCILLNQDQQKLRFSWFVCARLEPRREGKKSLKFKEKNDAY
jgi:hypothetical protein